MIFLRDVTDSKNAEKERRAMLKQNLSLIHIWMPGVTLLLAMLISSAVGTCIPLFFKKINIDPAVASGPLITTVNDLDVYKRQDKWSDQNINFGFFRYCFSDFGSEDGYK